MSVHGEKLGVQYNRSKKILKITVIAAPIDKQMYSTVPPQDHSKDRNVKHGCLYVIGHSSGRKRKQNKFLNVLL